jgi:hypothetical protein
LGFGTHWGILNSLEVVLPPPMFVGPPQRFLEFWLKAQRLEE